MVYQRCERLFHENREIANIRGAFTKLPGERDCSQPVSLPGLFFLPHLSGVSPEFATPWTMARSRKLQFPDTS